MYAADARHNNRTLEEKLQALYTLRGGPAIDLTIREPYRKLLSALAEPHKALPPVIHVAGTNGKGSVIAMLRAVFEAAGYKVHAYTSPHLTRFNERIVLAGQDIKDTALESLLDETVAANRDAPLTFFEITTAMAFLAFSRTPADICLLETGLGGRLDCTNVIEQPLATIITHIGYDHMEFLGETLEEIAAEKAGIMKPGVPCILAPQRNREIDDIFLNRAEFMGCRLIKADPAAAGHDTNLTGPHQRGNEAAALACLHNITGFEIKETAVKQGLQTVRWPARLQRITAPQMTPGSELWLDGGHNASAAEILAEQAALWAQHDPKPLHLILGMMKTKDPAAFIRPLAPYIDGVTCTGIPHSGESFTAKELQETIGAVYKGPVVAAEDFNAAIASAVEAGPGRILVTGSLYLAGYVLSAS